MKELHPKQIEAVLSLPAPRRYDHFVKQVADSDEVWGLYNDGWALASTDDGAPTFPMWPAREYAAMCATKDWAAFQPKSIPLEQFIDEFLPDLETKGILPSVFYTPEGLGVNASTMQLIEDLREELKKYN